MAADKKTLFFSLVILVLFTSTIILVDSDFSPINIRPIVVEKGDIVRLDYILSTVDEVVLDTSYSEVAGIWGLNISHPFEPIVINVGDKKILQNLEDALIGMTLDEQQEIILSPEEGFGVRDEDLIRKFPKTTTFQIVDTMKREAFNAIFRDEPTLGRNYSTGYWNTTISSMEGDKVTLLNHARNTTIATHRGMVNITIEGDKITVRTEPAIGSFIETTKGSGVVTSVDSDNYTVDTNHLLAGQSLVFFIHIVDIIKPGQSRDGIIGLGGLEFIISLDTGRNFSLQTGKPLFLYFHATWCRWCRKFEADVLTDTGVSTVLNSNFVRVAIDVDVGSKVARDFSVFGTPTIVFLDKNGSEVKRMRGYIGVEPMLEILQTVKEKSLS